MAANFSRTNRSSTAGRRDRTVVEREDLEKPTRFATAKAPFYGKQNNAISWFKDDAVEHLSRIRTRVAILQSHGVSVKALKTDRAGYIVHEDECQIVAEPFQGEQS